jgi:hypothetical protein
VSVRGERYVAERDALWGVLDALGAARAAGISDEQIDALRRAPEALLVALRGGPSHVSHADVIRCETCAESGAPVIYRVRGAGLAALCEHQRGAWAA